jgi:hypothetical protein
VTGRADQSLLKAQLRHRKGRINHECLCWTDPPGDHIHPLLTIIQKLQESGRDEKEKQSALSNSQGQIDVASSARKSENCVRSVSSRFSSNLLL